MRILLRFSMVILFLLLMENIAFSQTLPVSITPVTKGNNVNNSGTLGPDNINVNVSVLPTNGSTSGNGRAPQGSRRYLNVKYLITGAEMTASGFSGAVTSIGWRWNTSSGVGQSIATRGRLLVYLKDTTAGATALNSTVIDTSGTTGYTKIIDGEIALPTTATDFSVDVAAGGPGTSTFTPVPGHGVIVMFVYQTMGTLSTTNPTVMCNTALAGTMLSTYQSNTTPGVNGTASNFRPETRFANNLVDVVEVTQIYALGKIPVPFGNPDVISVLVTNKSDAPISFDVNLSVKNASNGTVRFADSQPVADLSAGASTTLTFSGYTASIIETDSITASVDIQAGETYTANNSKSVVQQVNSNAFSYSQGLVAAGGVGFTGATGDFVAKFTTNSSNSINQIDVNFSGSGQPFNVGIWDNTGPGGTPGTNLYTSTGYTSSAGVYTIIVNPPVAVNGSFFVGVRQTGTTNVAFSYQSESPIRSSTFYYTSPTGSSTWTDFAPANSFRFMIEPKFALNNDVGVSSIGQSGTVYYPSGTTSTPMTGVVANYGLLSASFDVTRTIKDNTNSQVYSNTQSISNLASNSTSNVTFTSFTFTPGVTYTIKDSTTLSGDQNAVNDTSSKTFTPLVAKPTCILYTDVPSRDSVAAQMTRAGYGDTYDMIDGATFTSSFSAWKSVFYVLASSGTWTTSVRDSLKNFLDNSTLADKKSLYIFGNDLGYVNDPIRNVTAPAADTVFYRQYLRGQYIADNWITVFTGGSGKFNGIGAFSSVSGDSSADAFPDLVQPVNGGIAGFIPVTESGDGDSCIAVYYTGNYNIVYGTNTYSAYRSSLAKSPFTIFQTITSWGIANGGVLPVELTSFTSVVKKDGVVLNWSTASEIKNSGFAIERSTDKTSWNKLGFVNGAGNSNSAKLYTFTDNTVSVNGKYYYRLKQVDTDGSALYSDIIEVDVTAVTTYELSQNYPNPFNPSTVIKYQVPVTGLVTLKVFDVLGKEVSTLVNEVKQGGAYSITFNASALSSGIYFYRLQSGNFTSVKKFTLIK